KHRLAVDGHKCSYSKQIHQEKLNAAVEEIIKKIVHEPKFEEAIKAKINARIDTDEIDTEIASLQKRLRQLTGAKDRIGRSIDALDYLDPCYDNKYVDLQKRLDDIYIEINAAEAEIAELKEKADNIRRNKISEEKVYEFLLLFDILYDKMTDAEKKEVLASFIERVDVYPEPKENGQILKSITFRIPIVIDGDTGNQVNISFPNENVTVETVVLLSR
ncbi:MAG: recombinase family protein, partial [Clostridia bacterium]|nr:recombinase family protein [Clostridia bacterium]